MWSFRRYTAAFTSSAIYVMFAGTLLFYIAEAITFYAVRLVSAPLFYVIRVPAMLIFMVCVFRFRRQPLPTCTLPRNWQQTDLHHWRAVSWTTTALLFAYSFQVHKVQTMAYVLTLLHPMWTILMSPAIRGKRPKYNKYVIPLLGLVIGVGLYLWPFGEFRLTHLAPLFAGVAFAITNLLSGRIADDRHENSAITNFYTAYYSLILLPFVVIIFWSGDGIYANVDSGWMVIWVIGLAVIAAFVFQCANLCITHAFAVSKNDGVVSSIDLTIIVFAAAGDAIKNPDGLEELGGPKGLGVMFIIFAAFLITYLYESEAVSGVVRRTDKLQ